MFEEIFLFTSIKCFIRLPQLKKRPKWPNTILGRNISRSNTVCEIIKSLPLFWNSSLLCNSSFMKNSMTNLKTIFQRTRVIWQTWVSQTQVSKEWYISIYFQNSDRSSNILANNDIWPFWPLKSTKEYPKSSDFL